VIYIICLYEIPIVLYLFVVFKIYINNDMIILSCFLQSKYLAQNFKNLTIKYLENCILVKYYFLNVKFNVMK